jgi:hypothetical protein
MDKFSHRNNLTPFDTNWREGSGATPLATQDLFFGDAISIPTAPTDVLAHMNSVISFELMGA